MTACIDDPFILRIDVEDREFIGSHRPKTGPRCDSCGAGESRGDELRCKPFEVSSARGRRTRVVADHLEGAPDYDGAWTRDEVAVSTGHGNAQVVDRLHDQNLTT